MKRLLVLVEIIGNTVSPASLAAIAFAQAFARLSGATYDFLAASADIDSVQGYGAAQIFNLQIDEPVPEEIAQAAAQIMRDQKGLSLAGAESDLGISILARAAGLLGLPLLTGVSGFSNADNTLAFRCDRGKGREAVVRPIGDQAVFTAAATAFGAPSNAHAKSAVKTLAPEPAACARYAGAVELLPQPSDLQTARVVVAGGRALRDAETFERLIGGLAEKLGGAKAASGAAVQAGIAPTELLIGQTGASVAPDLYIAAGISGSDQHTAGFSDAKVVVAINSNPNAAIFRMADYGLVADVHQALPELIEKL